MNEKITAGLNCISARVECIARANEDIEICYRLTFRYFGNVFSGTLLSHQLNRDMVKLWLTADDRRKLSKESAFFLRHYDLRTHLAQFRQICCRAYSRRGKYVGFDYLGNRILKQSQL